MPVTTDDRFPARDRSDAGQPDAYGLRPAGYRLPDATRIREVSLQVTDLTRSVSFYTEVLGLHPISTSPRSVQLGAAGSTTPLITLVENRGTRRRKAPKALGLYHVAILLPSRGDLGRFLRHLSDIGARAGASDHLVSEALYLQDPDDLGIEVYSDRPRSTWQHRDRQLVMATDPLDVRSVVAAGSSEDWRGVPVGTVIGHVHLHVGDLEQGARFYADALGFDRMVWSYPSALFLAAGGYHHHLGTNVWAGPGARAPEPDDPQLLEWVLELPSLADVADAARSVRSGGFVTDAGQGDSMVLRDPWGTAVRIAPAVGSVHP